MALKRIQGVMRAEAVVVAQFAKVNKRFGGKLKISAPYGAYRSRAAQLHLYKLFLSGRGPTAAAPGNSMHERGLALDIWNWALFPTLPAVMKAYGFTPIPGEKWHYNFTGVPVPKPVTRPVIKRGSKGVSVGVLQRALKLKIDNLFGSATESKVKAFQKANGLVPDGIVGASTWGKLAKLGKL
jgi:peptidoglycan hydrolase-like protein with peptidoglycan-binding domain